jgi:hypothetical protein
MKLEFSSIEEVKDFVAQLKGKRGAKGDPDELAGMQQAPAPMMPPANPPLGFNNPMNPAPSQGFNPAPPFATPAASAEEALAKRIATRIDSAIASGQPPETALNWFRTYCGPEAAAATMDQIKTVFLLRLPLARLEEAAKLMHA